MEILWTTLFVGGLIVLHETGHVIAAKLMRLSILKVGVQFKPYPHAYVSVKWPLNALKRFIYLFSGSAMTLLLFSIALAFNFFDFQLLYVAFALQIAIETNPFYSDFTIAILSTQNQHNRQPTPEETQEKSEAYMFSAQWYLHFLIWSGVIFLLIWGGKHLF